MALAIFACDPARSRGRRHTEPAASTRTEYQRDRDRVIHCSAFWRLVYKTQVFLNREGDLFRTGLTHSLEVAQLGRSIARSLGLDEDLVEAIALAHDLGHTPFDHAGQDTLNACMSEYGGFEHNLQSLRIVDLLEQRYPDFDGLNLTFEAREGILKHCSAKNAQVIEAAAPAFGDGLGAVGQRFLDRTQPSLEAQLCKLSDEIAYNAHDIDDGVRSGLITIAQLEEVHLLVIETADQAKRIVRGLFAAYMHAPREIQPSFGARSTTGADVHDCAFAMARVVADYIAGMTDRFAAREHERLTGLRLLA